LQNVNSNSIVIPFLLFLAPAGRHNSAQGETLCENTNTKNRALKGRENNQQKLDHPVGVFICGLFVFVPSGFHPTLFYFVLSGQRTKHACGVFLVATDSRASATL